MARFAQGLNLCSVKQIMSVNSLSRNKELLSKKKKKSTAVLTALQTSYS